MAQKFTRPVTPGAAPKQVSTPEASKPVQFIFDKSNYTILAVAILVVIVGFVLMSGTTDIYSTTKIVVAPIVVLAGFGLGFYAILKKPQVKA
jgi:cell division protein FtsL